MHTVGYGWLFIYYIFTNHSCSLLLLKYYLTHHYLRIITINLLLFTYYSNLLTTLIYLLLYIFTYYLTNHYELLFESQRQGSALMGLPPPEEPGPGSCAHRLWVMAACRPFFGGKPSSFLGPVVKHQMVGTLLRTLHLTDECGAEGFVSIYFQLRVPRYVLIVPKSLRSVSQGSCISTSRHFGLFWLKHGNTPGS